MKMIVENIESTFNFGKYKGEIIKDVALKDPSYIEWLCIDVERFVITNEIIDELSNYCLSVFFNDPEKYLNEEGYFEKTAQLQKLKYNDKELTIGSFSSAEFSLNALKERGELDEKLLKIFEQRYVQLKGKHIPKSISRLVFNSQICKKNLSDRKKTL